VITLCCGIQCRQQNSGTYFTGEEGGYGYNLAAPNHTYKLPKILREISGLSYYQPGVLACIQDEDGKLFLYDLEQEDILSDQKFAGDDDYEGISLNDQQVFVVNSSGDIFSFMMNDEKAEKIKTPLNSKYDVEGLMYRAGENDLILACKENPDNEDEALFFSFDLSKQELSEEPVITIKFDEVKPMLKERNFSTVKHLPFKPSGVAVHPLNHQIYVIASVGKLLLILAETGDLLKVVPLPPNLFIQPEGICFDNQGNLYIASEGKKSAARLFMFERTRL
jgi:uncharacterized protein YjiK